MFEILIDDLTRDDTGALLALHLRDLHAASPPEFVFALDLSGLQVPEITLWSVREADCVIAIGALKALGDNTGEIKSMRTHPDHVRRGVAARLVEHLIAEARNRGWKRLSLETGTGPAFEPALALYRKCGFTSGAPFSDYTPSAFNQFLHLPL